MTKTKNIPMRMCVACHEMKPKKDMLRVVKTADGEIYADPTGKAAGRGAYVCGAEECMRKLNLKKLLKRAFASNVSVEVYADVEGGLKGND